jgi:hypothetical protein
MTFMISMGRMSPARKPIGGEKISKTDLALGHVDDPTLDVLHDQIVHRSSLW